MASLNNAQGGSYQFADNNLANGINYYRIKSVDVDGAFAISNVITLNSNCNGTIITVSPNPVKDVVNVTGLTGSNTILILDASGRRMVQILTINSTQRINMGGFAVFLLLHAHMQPAHVAAFPGKGGNHYA